MIVDYLQYFHSDYLFIFLLKDKSVWLGQIHSILSFSITVQRMASANAFLHKHFNG